MDEFSKLKIQELELALKTVKEQPDELKEVANIMLGSASELVEHLNVETD